MSVRLVYGKQMTYKTCARMHKTCKQRAKRPGPELSRVHKLYMYMACGANATANFFSSVLSQQIKKQRSLICQDTTAHTHTHTYRKRGAAAIWTVSNLWHDPKKFFLRFLLKSITNFQFTVKKKKHKIA